MVLNVRSQAGGTVRSMDYSRVLDVELSDYIFGGFRVSTNSTTSTAISIPTGSGILQGFYIEEDGTGSVNTATASSRGYLFIQLTVNAQSEPSSVEYLVTSAETTANSIRIARLEGGTGGTTTGSIFLEFPMISYSQKQFTSQQALGLF